MNFWRDQSNVPLVTAMLLAFLGFSAWTVGDALVRYMNAYNPFQIGFMATFFSFILLLIFSKPMGGLKESFQKPKQKLQILRGLILSISGLLSYFTFMNLPLTKAYAIIFCAPFVAKIVSILLTGEQIKLRSWLITIVGFIGVLIVLQPGSIPLNLGTASAIGLAIFFGIGHVMGRFIGQENQTLFGQVFYNKVFNMVLMGIPSIWLFETMPMTDVFITFCLGITGVLGAFLVSWGFSVAPAAYIAPIHYTQIILGTIWGILLFGEYPDTTTYVGGTIIVGAGLALTYFGRQRELKNLPKNQ